MAEELNVGRIVAEIVLEAETKKAEEQIKSSAETIKSDIKNTADNTEITVKVDTQQAEKQIKTSADNIKSQINSLADPNMVTKINWNDIRNEWQRNEEELKKFMPVDIEIPVAIVPETISSEDMIEKLTGQLETLGIKSEDIKTVMENCFGDLSVYSQYENKLNTIATKLDIQKHLVSKLQAEYDRYQQSGLQTSKGDKIVANFEKEKLKLAQLEIQYDKTQSAQDNYVNQKVTAYQRGVIASENATAREIANQQKLQNRMDRSNTALIFADLTTSLRSFNAISPGVVGNIGTIVRQINLLRRASQSGASVTVMAISSVLAVAGTLAVLVANYYNSIKEKQEEARKKAVSLAETFEENRKNIQKLTEEYTDLKFQIDESVLSNTEQKNSQEKLIELQKELISIYGNEAKVLDLVNGKINEQVEAIEHLNKKQAENHIADNFNAYNEAIDKLQKHQIYDFMSMDITRNFPDDVMKILERYSENPNNKIDALGFRFTVDTKDAEQELRKLFNYIKNSQDIPENVQLAMQKQISDYIAKLDTEKIDGYKIVVEQYEKAQDIVNGKTEETIDIYNQMYEQIKKNESAVESLSSAYEKLNSGEQLDNSKLIELLDTYPKLVEYIVQTGDLSLANGEKIKEAQAEILRSSISSLNQERASLTFKKNRTAEENQLLQKIIATTNIYKNQLKELNSVSTETPKLNLSDFKTAVNDFGNAYKTLADGKELDLNTTLDLIEKYPKFAKMLNNGSNSVDGQRKAVEKLFEAKKKEMLMSLQADQQELQSLVTTTKAKISEYDKLIEKYNFISSAVMDYRKKQSELKNNLSEYSDSLNQVKSQISAINNLNIESYKNTQKSTSATNERLQEQLKLIEHRRALNNLSYAEEISWLQMLYREYTETAEERMSLEEKIYTAQQNAVREQEQAYSDLYNTQIKNLEHLKNLDQLNKEQELAWLNTLYSQYVLTADERMSLEEKIYSVQKDIQEEREQAIKNAMQSELNLLEHEKNMDKLSAENELLWLERIYNFYEMSYEDRLSMEEKIHHARKSYEEEIQRIQQETLDKRIEALEKARSSAKITYEEELRRLRDIYRTQKLTLEQQEKLLEQIRSLQKSAKSERSGQFSTVGEGVVEALKNRYQQQRNIEEQVINNSINNWKKWEEETVKAIQSQIDALDKLANAQESENKRREYENKREATELLLKYEKDDYNRKQYIKELNRLDNEESKRLSDEQRENQKRALQSQIDTVKEQSQIQQDLLNAELETISKNYEKLMSSYSLENEAYKMMLGKSQDEIISFVLSYAPEYEMTGRTLGEKLYSGLKSKIKNIDFWFQRLDVVWGLYNSQINQTAHQAVDKFWASREEYQKNLNAMTTVPNVNLTVNFNEPVQSPVQVARKLEEVTNNLVSQLKR